MDFGRILTAMVTPFNSQDELDLEKVEPLVEHLINNGTEGLVVAGTTGESPTMTKDEKLKLFEHVAKVVNGRIPVLAGTGSNSTIAAAELTKEAEATGVDGIMLVTPYYNKPNARGLYEHFKSIAAATNLPIMLYNIPGRSAINMSVDVTVSLANIPNIVSIKDASGSLDMMSEIIHRTPDDFSLYSGDDSLTIPAMSVGANGIVSVASHVIGNEIKEMVDQFSNGNVKLAAEIHRNILPKMKACFMAPSPSPVKAALNHYGIEVGSVRLPLVEITEDEKNLLIHTIQ